MWGIVFTPAPSVRHWDRLWSSAIKGEGDSVGWFGLVVCPTLHLWIADQVRNDEPCLHGLGQYLAMVVWILWHCCPALWILP